MQRQTNRFVLFAGIAFLTFAEAFFTHLGSLRTLAENAAALGISPETARLRLGVLSLWDLLAALGAGLVTAGLTRFLKPAWIPRGIRLTLLGLLGYALTQTLLAIFVPDSSARLNAGGMALLYLGLAILVWRLRR
ncbi:MAG: hypothetical protein D6755_14375 [Anaerolineae bacterium]|nr:MAG: hypothetical protein D6755_14375 [Anaerolineae bacterium]